MYKTLRENTALSIFAVITAVQAVFALLRIGFNGSEIFSFAFLLKFVLLCAASLFAAISFGITPLFSLFTVTSPFMLLTVSSDTGASDNGRAYLLIAAIAFMGLLHLLWKGKKRGLFWASLVLGIIGAVLAEKFFVFECGDTSLKMSFSYLLFEKTFWPHFVEYQYILPGEYGQFLTDSDMNPVFLREVLAGDMAGALGDKAGETFLKAAGFAVSVGTKTFVKESVIRLLLFVLAPFSLLLTGVFGIPDTYAAENLLKLSGDAPLLAKWYLVFFVTGLTVMIAGTFARAISLKKLKDLLLGLLKLLAVLTLMGLFLYYFRLPCFDIRDAGACIFLFTAFFADGFLRSKGRCLF